MGNQLKQRYFSLLDILFLIFGSIILTFLLTTIPSNPHSLEAVIILLLLISLVFFVAFIRRKKIKLRWLTIIYPLIFLLGIFETFFMIIPWFNELRYDQALLDIDYNLFGVHPSVWIEQFHHPVLTDALYLLYFFYFPLQTFIPIYLFRKKMYRAMEKSLFVLMICNFGAYISYFYFPAVGPRFFIEHLQTIQLDGIILAKPITSIINFMEPNKLDAFPSLHTGILIVSLLLMNKYHKKLFYYMIIPAIGIFISLVYCRYHYVIDIFAGAIWSIIAYWVGNKLFDKYSSKFTPAFYSKK